MSTNVVQLASVPRQRHEETVEVAKPFCHIEPGVYEALSVSVRPRQAFKREYLETWFDVYAGAASNGQILGRLPGFFRLTGRPLAPSSALGRWIQLLGVSVRRDRVPLRLLEAKLWKVEVRDVLTSHQKEKDAEGKSKPKRLPPALIYSKVALILERLA